MAENTSSDDEILPEDRIFSSRAKDFTKTCDEEMNKMLSEMEKEKPKQSTCAKSGRKSNGQKKLQKVPVLNEIDFFSRSPKSPEVKLKPAAKRRLKKLERERMRNIKRIARANKHALSFCSSLPKPFTQTNCNADTEVLRKTVTLKIRYMADIIRIKWGAREKFSALFTKVATSFNLKATEILLFVNDRNLNVEDTPDSLKLTICDIIDCVPFQAAENMGMIPGTNRIQIKVQSNDSRKKVEIYVHKLEKMQDIMERYAVVRNISLDYMDFEFDGDKIKGTETPDDLDMERGCCLDVTILKSPKKIAPAIDKEGIGNPSTSAMTVIDVSGESSGGSAPAIDKEGIGNPSTSAMTVIDVSDDSSGESDVLIIT